MSRARLPHQWVDTPTMLASLMIIVGILGYIFLKRILMFSKFFGTFRTWLSENLAGKIHAMQTDWGGEYEKLGSFFQRIGIAHRVSCPHAHQQNGRAEWKIVILLKLALPFLLMLACP